MDIVKMNTGHDLASTGADIISSPYHSSTVTNLPEKVTVFFDSGATLTDASGEFALNEVVDIMARRPEIRLLITGYSDKSGSSSANLRLSEKRSLGVKSALIQSGIDPSRITTRYLGDTDASSVNGIFRKVTIEFL